MCGIFGDFASPSRDVRLIADAALDSMRHRGPDDRGASIVDGGAIGMTRLSIIDLEGGHQPMWTDDAALGIVYNGELYNFRQLRAELRRSGASFRTASDTEVVLEAFRAWGPECLHRFNGMFAFAVWDTRVGRIFVARDRIGEKPLYYFHNAATGHFAFASEIKALLSDPAIPREIDLRGLGNYLSFGHAVAPRTMFSGIRKLPPGHYVIAAGRRIDVRSYWDVPAVAPSSAREADGVAVAHEVRELLTDSVDRRLVADVPVGVFLSGGIDSTVIVALASATMPEPVQTFSVGFQAGSQYDELGDAQLAASAFATNHHELRVTPSDLVGVAEKLVFHYDEPFADAAALPVYLLSRFAREHVKVVLTGDGADELFGGYRRYKAEAAAVRLAPFMPDRVLASTTSGLRRMRRTKRLAAVLPMKDGQRRYEGWLEVFTPELRHEILQPAIEELCETDASATIRRHYSHRRVGSVSDHLNRVMYTDVKTWLADCYMEKTDKATMAAGLEARLPFLDHRLVELAFRIPGSMKVGIGSTKRVLRAAVRDLVPTPVLQKRKHGFAVPTDRWFRRELREYAYEVMLDGSGRRSGYFDASVIERMWREHAKGRHVWDSQLWALMNFELWHRTFLRVPT